MSTPDLFDIAQKEAEAQGAFKSTVLCCGSTACLTSGGQAARDAIDEVVAANGLERDVRVVSTDRKSVV